jgi:hypothetical protein
MTGDCASPAALQTARTSSSAQLKSRLLVLLQCSQIPFAASIQAFATLLVRLARVGPSPNGKSIDFVAGGEVDPTASDDASVPFARIGHLLVRPTPCVNDFAGVAIVAV